MDYRDDAFSTFGEEILIENSGGIEFVRTPLVDQISQTDDLSSINIAVNPPETVSGEGRDVPDSEVIDINESEVASTETVDVINSSVVGFIQRIMVDSSEEEDEDAEGEGEEGEEEREEEGDDEVDN